MMVKIIALGMTPAIWKNVFHHFRTYLPDVRFSAGMFSTPEELAFLRDGALARGTGDELPDIVLAGVPAPSEMKARLSLLESWSARESGATRAFVLAFPALEHGLRALVQGRTPVQLHLDKKASFTLADPNLILKTFPAEFPRVRVNAYLSAVQPAHARKLLSPEQIEEGRLLGFSEIEAVHQGEQAFAPAAWIRNVLKAEKIKLDAALPLALMRERRGLFLFPGIPVGRVQSITLGGVRFTQLIDLGLMTDANPHFKAVLKVIAAAGTHHGRVHETFTRRLRHAEARRDMPVICRADEPALAEAMQALLQRSGFQRVFTAHDEGAGTLRESALVLNLSGDPRQFPPAGKTKHLLFDVAGALHEALAHLGALLDWSTLHLPPQAQPREPITADDFDRRCQRLATRARKAEAGLSLAVNRRLLLEQERGVLHAALSKLDALLNAKDAIQVWNGAPTQGMRQVLVLSHDQEEAGAVLQALPGIAKKRWFDLSPFRDADSLQNLTMEGLQEYRDGGLMIITATSRERLAELHAAVSARLADVDRQSTENDSALTFFEAEAGKIDAAEANLALDWVYTAAAGWLAQNRDELLSALAELRRTNERDWFHRRTVRRVFLIASNGENRQVLMQTCEDIYPTLGPDGAQVFPYDLELPVQLNAADTAALRERMQQEGLGEGDLRGLAQETLARQNDEAVTQYLDVLRTQLEGCEADVVLIEHPLPVTERIMALLRKELPALAQTPAVCILPGYWAPEEGEPMPWARTRVALLRRMGPLTVTDCQDALRALYTV
ncbi:MAG: hypothetical protein HY342_12640 [Candidatus Lambdaproteobacteria bacterium]|nr:hypothetical protein [Candidatus Lambdaproteobacteria bacterium]